MVSVLISFRVQQLQFFGGIFGSEIYQILILFGYRFWASFWDGFWIENGCQHGSFWEAFGEPERSKMSTKKRCMCMWVCVHMHVGVFAPSGVSKSTPRGAKKHPQRLPRGHLGVLLAISGGVFRVSTKRKGLGRRGPGQYIYIYI